MLTQLEKDFELATKFTLECGGEELEATRRLRAEIERIVAANERMKEALEGMMEIAEIAMPNTYFKSDSRCVAARKVMEDQP